MPMNGKDRGANPLRSRAQSGASDSLLNRAHALRVRAEETVESAPALLRSKLGIVGELAELLVDMAQQLEDQEQ